MWNSDVWSAPHSSFSGVTLLPLFRPANRIHTCWRPNICDKMLINAVKGGVGLKYFPQNNTHDSHYLPWTRAIFVHKSMFSCAARCKRNPQESCCTSNPTSISGSVLWGKKKKKKIPLRRYKFWRVTTLQKSNDKHNKFFNIKINLNKHFLEAGTTYALVSMGLSSGAGPWVVARAPPYTLSACYDAPHVPKSTFPSYILLFGVNKFGHCH